jgi:chromate transporter
MRKIRYYIFLRDVFILAVTSFGGANVHIPLFLKYLVEKRKYVTEEELLELNALCQILPGPTSTQTLTAIGFKIGGPNLAYLTLLVWILPAVIVMTVAGLIVTYISDAGVSLAFTKFLQPIIVGFVAFSAYTIISKVINTKTSITLLILSALLIFFVRSPFIPPIVLVLGGLATTWRFKKHPVEEKKGFEINWSNFILWISVPIVAAAIGLYTGYKPIRLFENFYRNGSMIFGGGQVLIPLLYTEFVEFKHYLTSQEFSLGYGIAQVVPGPVFSFTSYIGVLSMRDHGTPGEILGSVVSMAGIFLPGTFLIFFVIRFWNHLKKYRFIRASLEGINAVSAGLVSAAAIILFQPINSDWYNYLIVAITFCILAFTRLPPPILIIGGIILGFMF